MSSSTSPDAARDGSPRQLKCGADGTKPKCGADGATPKMKDDFENKASREIENSIVEVDTKYFVQRLVRRGDTRLYPSSEFKKAENLLDQLARCSKESDMYPTLCEVGETIAPQDSPWKFAVVGDSHQEESSPDIAVYPEAQEELWRVKPSKGTKFWRGHVYWGWMALMIEAKLNAPPAFGFPSKDSKKQPSFLPSSGAEARAQHFKHAAEIFRAQHRHHLFSIYIVKQGVRLVYFDRAGMVVSKPIDLSVPDGKRTLCEFLWLVTSIGEIRLGYDTSAKLASDEDINRIPGIVLEHEYLSKWRNEMILEKDRFPIYKVYCEDVHEDADDGVPAERPVSSYLIGKPCSSHYSLFGRGTKGYIAWHLEKRRWVFLKDMWKDVSNQVHSELEVYKRLKQNNVRCVPTAIGGGTCGSITDAQDLFPSAAPRPARVHTRLVLLQVARPLEDYQDAKHLILIIWCALSGHFTAWTRASILHRDISIGNIMIGLDGNGLLVDWDLCKFKEELYSKAAQPFGRSGTWPFMSALSLSYVKKPIELADDLESFLYVLLWMVLRFHLHNKTSQKPTSSLKELMAHNGTNINLSRLVSTFFLEEFSLRDGYIGGGENKKSAIWLGYPPFTLLSGPDQSKSPFAQLISDFYALLRDHYLSVDLDKLERFVVDVEHPQLPLPNTAPSNLSVPMFPEVEEEVLDEPEPADVPSVVGPSPTFLPRSTTHVETDKRVLDSHRAMLRVFVKYTRSDVVWHPWANAKTVDQFVGLGRFVMTEPTPDSGAASTGRRLGAPASPTG